MRLGLLVLALLPLGLSAQNRMPAPAQKAPVVIEGATVHVGNGQVYQPGYVVLAQGKIAAVGQGAAPAGQVPQGATRVAAAGKHVYPGLIVANNLLGLDEVGAVRSTHDYAEVGESTPEVLATTAFNASSIVIPTVRANGVLTAHTVPAGNAAPGRGGIVQLDAWTNDDAVLVRSVGPVLNIPNRFNNSGWWAEPGTMQANEGRAKDMAALRSLLADARSYCKAPKGTRPANERLEAFRNAFAGTEAVMVQATYPREIMEGIQMAKEFGFPRIILCSSVYAVRVAPYLAKEKIPVILFRIHSLPMRGDSDYDEAYAAPGKLRAAGVDFCLDISGDMEPMQARNLGLMAGTAQGYGLTEEQALEAVTLAPARILGISGRLGSLDTGKDATLFISDGPFSDIRTGKVAQAYIQGRAIDMGTHQKELYRKYAGRYGLTVVE